MPEAYISNSLLGDLGRWPDRHDDPLLPEEFFEEDTPRATEYVRSHGNIGPRPEVVLVADEVPDFDLFADPANSLEIIETEAPILAEACDRPIKWVTRRFRAAAHLEDAPTTLPARRRERPRLEPEFPKRIGRLKRKHEALLKAWHERPAGILCWRAVDA